MAKLPNPPTVRYLQAIKPVTKTLRKGAEVVRLFFAGGNHTTSWDAFRYYGPTASRFDHHRLNNGLPQLQSRGIMYLASGKQSIPACLAEVFQTSRVIDRNHNSPILAAYQLATSLTLLDLSGPFCTTIGASTAIGSGPRPMALRWSQRLYDAYPKIDGLFYSSSMYGNAPVIALYERGLHAIPQQPVFHRSLNDPVLQQVILLTGTHIRYAVV